MFLSCRPFVVITLSTGLVDVEVTSVSWLEQNCSSQETEVDNVVIATKGLQDRTTNVTDGTTVENKGKLILNIFMCIFIS